MNNKKNSFCVKPGDINALVEAYGGHSIFVTMGPVALQSKPVVTFQFPDCIVASGLGLGTAFTRISCGLRTI